MILNQFIRKLKANVYSYEDMPELIAYIQKLIEQNDYLSMEIKKLLDEKETMQKRLEFCRNTTVNIRR